MNDLEILQNDYDSLLSKYVNANTETVEDRRALAEVRRDLAEMSVILNSYKHGGIASTSTPSVAPEVEQTLQTSPQTYDDFRTLIIGELKDAEKYNKFYKATGESGYKQLSNQEKSHAQFFIDKALKIGDADRIELSELKKRYDRIK